MHRNITALFSIVLLALNGSPAHGQARLLPLYLVQPEPKPPAPPAAPDAGEVKPAAQPADGAAPPVAADAAPERVLKIIITGVQNKVQVRAKEDQPWQDATPGMEITLGAEIRTGIRSACQVKIDGDHTVTLDRLGTIKMLDAVQRAGKVKTDVGMKYGRTEYKVEQNAQEHDSRVHAPAATLVVRGSHMMLQDDALFGATAIVHDSEEALFAQRGNDKVQFIPIAFVLGQIRNDDPAPVRNASPPPGAAFRDTISDTGPRDARATDQESELIALFPGTIGNDLTRFVPTQESRALSTFSEFAGGLGFQEDGSSGQVVSGQILVTLNWTGAADLNLFTTDSLGPMIMTGPITGQSTRTQIRSGGPAFAFAGGNNPGPNGFEDIHWNSGFPTGNWTVGAELVSGTAASFSGQVLQNVGQGFQVIHTFGGTLDPTNPVATSGLNVSSGGTGQ